MPKILGKGLIRFDANDFLAGLYAQYQTSISANPGYINNDLLVASSFNPYRALGYAAPGFNPTDLTTVSVMTGLGLNIAQASESGTDYGYVICNDDKLNRLVISTKTFSNAGSWPHSIVGTGVETGSDCLRYNLNVASTSTQCVLYSWNDSGGAWNVGIFNTSAGTFTDNYMTTVPATPLTASGNDKPHPMVQGSDDIVYIGDGNKLHAFDGATGANGTFSDSVLVLPFGFIIKSFAKLSNYLVIFGYYSTVGNSVATATGANRSAAFFYDYLSLDPTYVVPISGGAVTCAFEYNATVGCFVQGTKPVQNGAEDRYGSLRIWNGADFELKEQFIGNAPTHGGVDIVGNSIQWNSDGIIHSYNSPLVGAPDGLNKLALGTGTSAGLLRTVGGLSGYQIISSGTTTSGGGQYLKVTTFAASALIQTSAVAPTFTPGKIGRITRVSITFSTTASAGRVVNAYIVKDNGQTVQFVSNQSTVTNATLTAKYEEDVSGGEFGDFRELSLALSWGTGSGETSAPIIRNVDVQFEETNLVN